MNNKEFAETNERFKSTCERLAQFEMFKDLSPTKRQASKWRRRKGAAYKSEKFNVISD